MLRSRAVPPAAEPHHNTQAPAVTCSSLQLTAALGHLAAAGGSAEPCGDNSEPGSICLALIHPAWATRPPAPGLHWEKQRKELIPLPRGV